MLSIGKLGLGHAAYYEQSVADGREDYYSGAGEDQGRYIGRGSQALGLGGAVGEGELRHLFDGTYPDRRGRWCERRETKYSGPTRITLPSGDVIEGRTPVATAAFDLTFSAPKSVSVLWGLSDHATALEVRQAHEVAVGQSIDYLERTACFARRGAGGRIHIRGEGFVAAAYTHRMSRAGDPQLHTHVLVANATKADGRYTALHGAALYREAKTAGFLYHAVLRGELTRRLGVEWHRDPSSPHPELVGVDARLRHRFSKRADEIANQMVLAGVDGPRAANAAAIDTRAGKDYAVDGFSIRARWREELVAAELPDPRTATGRVPSGARRLEVSTRAVISVRDRMIAPDGPTANRSTFRRRDVLQLAAEAALEGASVAEVEQAADDAIRLAEGNVVLLDGHNAPIPVGDAVRADGVVLADGRADRAFTTRQLLECEQAILDALPDRAGEGVARAKPERVAELLDARPGGLQLADEQRRMVKALTTSGDGVEVVVGLAGAGKTFSFEAARDIWIDAGIEVRGCSTALAAAQNLQNETGIRAETIARLKHWVREAQAPGDAAALRDAFPRGGVLIVDEAGMVETRDLAFLVEQAEQRGTKLVLVGDHRQLPEIGAGGSFGGLVHRFEPDGHVSRLAENRRQRSAWERDALAELRAGSIADAIGRYVENDRIVVSADHDELRRRLARDWLDTRNDHPEVVMVAYTNNDVTALNHHARTALDERGQLGTERVTIAGREWAAGDELLCLRNNRRLGLTNGTRGTVTDAAEHGITIQTRDGATHRVPRDYLERGHATYGWATTGHKAQGITVNGEAFVLASDHISREWLYVAMSRARDASRIYVDTIDHDPHTRDPLTPAEQYNAAVVELDDMASRSAAQSMASDHDRDDARLSNRDLQRLSQRDDLPQAERDALALSRAERTALLRDELLRKPPSYLLPAIGPVPIDPAKQQQWARDAVRLEQHRRRHGLPIYAMTRELASRVLGRQRSVGLQRGFGREL